MAGEFGKFIDEKRRGRGPDGGDILLKDIAKAMGATPIRTCRNTLWMRTCRMSGPLSGKPTIKASVTISGSRSTTRSTRRSDSIVW